MQRSNVLQAASAPLHGMARRPSLAFHLASPRTRIAFTSASQKRHARSFLVRAEAPSGDKDRIDAANKEYVNLADRIEAEAAAASEALQGTSIYLVGMMGSGKSTMGKMVSQALGYCFFDTDSLIEQLAGKSIPQIFAEDGEADFRALETQVLQELSPFKNCIISTGGGAATRSENWGHMHAGISVWLNAPPELLAHRVVRDGTAARPLLQQPDGTEAVDSDDGDAYQKAVARLTQLLEERKEQYGAADIIVSLEGEDPATASLGAPAAVVVHRILSALNDRIKRDAASREERKSFQVVNENLPESMRVVKSINPVGQEEETDPYLP